VGKGEGRDDRGGVGRETEIVEGRGEKKIIETGERLGRTKDHRARRPAGKKTRKGRIAGDWGEEASRIGK